MECHIQEVYKAKYLVCFSVFPRSNYLSFVSQNKFPRRRTWLVLVRFPEESPVESVETRKQREKSGIGLGPVESWDEPQSDSKGGSGLGINLGLLEQGRH